MQLITRRLDESSIGGIRNCLQQNEIPQTLEQVDGESSGIVSGVDDLLHGAEQARTVGLGERVRQFATVTSRAAAASGRPA